MPSEPLMNAKDTPAAAMRLKSRGWLPLCQREMSRPRIRLPGPIGSAGAIGSAGTTLATAKTRAALTLEIFDPETARTDIFAVAFGALNVADQAPVLFLDVTVFTVFQVLPVLIWILTLAPLSPPVVFPETLTVLPVTIDAGMPDIETDDAAAWAGWAISDNTNASAISKLALPSAKAFMALHKRQ
jgi:hypothetical protein